MTSFGGPGGRQVVHKPIPPQRGSFPLDHDGECKHIMSAYLRCIRQQRGLNTPECRGYSKQYLTCRMDNNLMAPDEFSNLGFAKEGPAAVPDVPEPPGTFSAHGRSSNSGGPAVPTSSSSPSSTTDTTTSSTSSSSSSSSSTSSSSSPKQLEPSPPTKTPALGQTQENGQGQTQMSGKPQS